MAALDAQRYLESINQNPAVRSMSAEAERKAVVEVRY
jgi:thioredoxin reductase (NADPH)